MRGLMAVLLWIVATLAVVVAIPTSWAATHIQDQSGFIDFASRLGDDTEVREAAADLAGEALADRSGAPAGLHDRIATAVERAIMRFTDSSGWDDAWRETARRTHEELFADPTPTKIRVDFAPIVRLALDDATADLPISIPAPRTLPVVVSEQDPSQRIEAVKRADDLALAATAVAILAALGALALARKRSGMLAGLGVGAIFAAATWWLVGRIVVPRVVERNTEGSAYGSRLDDVLTDRIVASLDPTLVWVALGGAALVVLGLVSRALRS